MRTTLFSKLATGVFMLAVALAAVSVPASAQAGSAAPRSSYSTPVTGVVVGSDGHPLAADEIYFQGLVSGDIYALRTGNDGAFSASLPAGTYALRDRYGTVLVGRVEVGGKAVSLGRVSPPGRYSLGRLLDRQVVNRTIVTSPAPSGAYLPSDGAAPPPTAVKPNR